MDPIQYQLQAIIILPK